MQVSSDAMNDMQDSYAAPTEVVHESSAKGKVIKDLVIEILRWWYDCGDERLVLCTKLEVFYPSWRQPPETAQAGLCPCFLRQAYRSISS
jgi:hypothetical protein